MGGGGRVNKKSAACRKGSFVRSGRVRCVVRGSVTRSVVCPANRYGLNTHLGAITRSEMLMQRPDRGPNGPAKVSLSKEYFFVGRQ